MRYHTIIPGSIGPNTVGFTASVIYEQPLIDIPLGGKLIFKQLVNNPGNRYDNSTGVFTAPTAGLYLFAFFIVNEDGSSVNIVLKWNGHNIVQGCAEPVYDSHQETGGNVSVLLLNVGDQVWIETVMENVSILDSFSSFTGVLITRI